MYRSFTKFSSIQGETQSDCYCTVTINHREEDSHSKDKLHPISLCVLQHYQDPTHQLVASELLLEYKINALTKPGENDEWTMARFTPSCVRCKIIRVDNPKLARLPTYYPSLCLNCAGTHIPPLSMSARLAFNPVVTRSPITTIAHSAWNTT